MIDNWGKVDNELRLEWQETEYIESLKGIMTWYEATNYAKSIGEGWRLPTIEELKEACDNKIEGFKDIIYWSSSSDADDNSIAFYVDFYDGEIGYNSKSNGLFVRCVRGKI